MNVHTVVTEGTTTEEIVRQARKVNCDLVVIGSDGNKPYDRVLIGSNIQKMTRELLAVCPVVTVNHPIVHCNFKNILIPASFDHDMTNSLRKVFQAVKDLNSTYHLVFINTPDHFKDEKQIYREMDKVIELFPDQQFQKHVYNQQEIEKGILEVASELEADLIAMSTHNRLKKEKYNIGTAEIVAFKSPIPLLAVLLD